MLAAFQRNAEGCASRIVRAIVRSPCASAAATVCGALPVVMERAAESCLPLEELLLLLGKAPVGAQFPIPPRLLMQLLLPPQQPPLQAGRGLHP